MRFVKALSCLSFAVAIKCAYRKIKFSSLRRYLFTSLYRGADKSLARPGRNQATATEDFEFHISYL